MQPVYLSLWIFSYTFSLFSILTGFFLYWKQRETALKHYILHMLNMLAVIILFMAGLLSEIGTVVFLFLLFNLLGIMNFNVSRMMFAFANEKPHPVTTLILPLVFQAVLNLLFLFRREDLANYFVAVMFAPLIVAGVLIPKTGVKIRILQFWKSLPACAGFIGVMMFVFLGLYISILFMLDIDEHGFPHYYFSILYVAVNAASVSCFIYQIRNERSVSDTERIHAAQEKLIGRFSLTQRELEIAGLLVKGLTYQSVADASFISLSTVKKHAHSIYRKTGTKNGRQLSKLYNELKHF